METVMQRTERHEGRRHFRYCDKCSKNIPECKCDPQGEITIGVGHNLTAKGRMGLIPLDRDLDTEGITDPEIDALLRQDISDVMSEIRQHVLFFDKLDEARQDALIDLTFNLGIGIPHKDGLLLFQQMLADLEKGDYESAANQLKYRNGTPASGFSPYFVEVKGRAVENVNLIRTGGIV